MNRIEKIAPGSFEPVNHFYPKVQNSQLHPLVTYFFNMSPERMIKRFKHKNPMACSETLKSLLNYTSKKFHWGGADLVNVTTEDGRKKMVILETNSCPSGQKSMPTADDNDEYGGYKKLIEESFIPLVKKKRLPHGNLAVIYDKNYMECSGYASMIAELTGEDVFLVPLFNADIAEYEFKSGILHINYEGESVPIRAAFRYVTQKPWNRIPIQTKTLIFNSTIACLAGGRNTLMASKAYEFFNSKIKDSGLEIQTPHTIRDISKVEIPLWVEKFGGFAVIKDPYSNAGQGVYTVTSKQELDSFMEEEHPYDQFIVQSLIGNYQWSSLSDHGVYFHMGTVPNKKGQIFVHDVRVMVYSTPTGFRPCAIYARRAESELPDSLDGKDSWSILGTNLSLKLGENKWSSDTKRLILMDRKEFNTLGLSIDDLIEAYIQTVMSVISIDEMSQTLLSKKGTLKNNLFKSLDRDPALIKEIC